MRENGLTRDAEAVQQEESARRRPKSPWRTRLPMLAVLLAFALVAFVGLQLSSRAKVVPVGADKSHAFLRDVRVYEAAAQKAFTPALNSNKLTVDTAKIAADLQKQFPELKAVSVSLPVFGSQPTVYIQPTAPAMILASQDGLFVLDSNGRALISGNDVAKIGELDLPKVTDQSNLAIQVGQIALPSSTVAFITEVFGQLKAKGLTVTSFVLPSGTEELRTTIQGAGYYVKYNLHGDAREEAGTYLAVKARLDASHTAPHEYVDVRVENRAYYK